MKKIIYTLVILIITFHANAQTYINTTPVSGTWTLAGSPYIVTVAAFINGGTSLTIDPGVDVKFMPNTVFYIQGSLVASGTSAFPITFEANDTTGWHDDIISNGGWHGINFQPYQGSSDNSILKNCIIKDYKHGVNGNMNGYAALYIYRGLHVDSCDISHCQSIYNGAEGEIVLFQGGGAVEMEHTRIHDCRTRVATLRIGTGTGVSNYVHDSRIDHNEGLVCAIWIITSHCHRTSIVNIM